MTELCPEQSPKLSPLRPLRTEKFVTLRVTAQAVAFQCEEANSERNYGFNKGCSFTANTTKDKIVEVGCGGMFVII